MHENICAQKGLMLVILLGCIVALGQSPRKNSSRQKPASGLEQTDKAWLAMADVPRNSVTDALNALNALPATDAGAAAATYRAAKDQASQNGKYAAALMVAVALERANEAGAANAYQAVVSEAANTPYATSAAFRLHILEQAKSAPADADKLYAKIAADPESEGWFRLSDQWTLSTTRRAAWQALVDLRRSYLSFRLFSFIREKSFFPTHLAFLFVLLALGIGAKLLSLPLYVKAYRLMRLQPEISDLNDKYSDNKDELERQLNTLYKTHHVHPLSGCAVLLLDGIFVIWALYSLSSFAPQMALDGSRLWWIADVTQRDFRIMLAYAGGALVSALVTSQWESCSEVLGGFLFWNAAILGVAWYWQWPAYIFIFWLVLIIIGIVFHLLLTPVRMAATS